MSLRKEKNPVLTWSATTPREDFKCYFFQTHFISLGTVSMMAGVSGTILKYICCSGSLSSSVAVEKEKQLTERQWKGSQGEWGKFISQEHW